MFIFILLVNIIFIFFTPIDLAFFPVLLLAIITVFFMSRSDKQKHGQIIIIQKEVPWWINIGSILGIIYGLSTYILIRYNIISNPLFKTDIIRFPIFVISIGIILNIHSLLSLKNMYSGKPTIYNKQQIITTGTYKLVRHPIYLSFILINFGSSLLPGRPFISFLLTCYTILWAIKRAELEEKLLIEINSQHYNKYKEEVPMLFPTPKSFFKYIKELFHG